MKKNPTIPDKDVTMTPYSCEKGSDAFGIPAERGNQITDHIKELKISLKENGNATNGELLFEISKFCKNPNELVYATVAVAFIPEKYKLN